MLVRCLRCDLSCEVQDLGECPGCNCAALVETRHDVEVRLSWSELRVLCYWASSAVAEGDEAALLVSICRRIARHRPPDAPQVELAEDVGPPSFVIVAADGRVLSPEEC